MKHKTIPQTDGIGQNKAACISYPDTYFSPILRAYGAGKFERVLLAILTTYVDETGTGGKDQPIFASAGCVFDADGDREFVSQWVDVLDQHGLKEKGFHCKDDALRCPDVYTRLRKLVTGTSEKVFFRFIRKEEVETPPEYRKYIGSDYSFLTLTCMSAIADYARSKKAVVSYKIEAGCAKEKELREMIQGIRDCPVNKGKYAIFDLDFYDKAQVKQLQSADMIAWTLSRGLRNLDVPGFTGRKDLVEWVRANVDVAKWTNEDVAAHTLVNAINGTRNVYESEISKKKTRPNNRRFIPINEREDVRDEVKKKQFPITEDEFQLALKKVARKSVPSSESDSEKK